MSAIAAVGALPDPRPKGLACVTTAGPLGTLLLAASPAGLVRRWRLTTASARRGAASGSDLESS